MITSHGIKNLLDENVVKYNQNSFIENDPISIPRGFELKQDIEIAGFFAAILAWGNRKTIISNAKNLMNLMDNAPYDFIVNHIPTDLKALEFFVHRTFNSTDLLFIIEAFKHFYKENTSLEYLFIPEKGEETVKTGLENFHTTCFELPFAPLRTKKHIASPFKKSACKRLNMYLRWMVRRDNNGVDFGIWKNIRMAQLICPLDIHVSRVAQNLGLINTDKCDWTTAELLTAKLRTFDPEDPGKYDFALFGMGIDRNNSLNFK